MSNCRTIQRITRKLTDAEEVDVIEWIQANPSIFNKAHADYKNTKKRDQSFADKSRPAWRGVDRTGPIQMVSLAAYGVYKVDQASGQWQWYNLDDRPTAVGGREHVLPQGALYKVWM